MPEQNPSPTESRIVGALVRAGAWAALAASALTVAWVILMVAVPPLAGTDAIARIQALRADDARYSVMFVVVLPLGLVLVPVWIALASRAWRSHPVAASLTIVYGLMYAPLSTAAYWLQLTAARGVAQAYDRDPAAAVAGYQLLDFGATSALTTALDVLGYSVLGLGMIAAAVLLWSEARLARLAGLMFLASGALAIGGAAGVALRWDWLGAGAIASGPPFLIAIVAVTWLLWDQSRRLPTSNQTALAALAG